MELKDLILVIAPLIGVLIGAGIATVTKVFELRYLKQQESQKLLLSKLEELHQNLSNYITFSTKYSVNLSKTKTPNFLKKALAPNSVMDKLIENADLLLQPLPKINTMLMIYAPELKKQFDDLISSVEKLHELGAAQMNEKQRLEDFQIYNQSVISSCQKLLNNIEKKAAEIILINKQDN